MLCATVTEGTMSAQSKSESIDERSEERFQVLESKVLYQDRTIEELNDVVTRQQDQIDQIELEVKRLRTLFENPPEGTTEDGEDPPPPHY